VDVAFPIMRDEPDAFALLFLEICRISVSFDRRFPNSLFVKKIIPAFITPSPNMYSLSLTEIRTFTVEFIVWRPEVPRER